MDASPSRARGCGYCLSLLLRASEGFLVFFELACEGVFLFLNGRCVLPLNGCGCGRKVLLRRLYRLESAIVRGLHTICRACSLEAATCQVSCLRSVLNMGPWFLHCLSCEEVVGMCDEVGSTCHVVKYVIRISRRVVVPNDGLNVIDHLLAPQDPAIRRAPLDSTRCRASRPFGSREVGLTK